MPEVQAVSVAWVVLICLILGCAQIAVLRSVCRRHREMAGYLETVGALVAAMQPEDVRDHCRRVASISGGLARELRLPARSTALVRTAALFHEVGRSGCSSGCLPMESAILAVADSFDSIVCGQGDSTAVDKAIEDIRREAGTRFHPAAVKAVMTLALQMPSTELRADGDHDVNAVERWPV